MPTATALIRQRAQVAQPLSPSPLSNPEALRAAMMPSAQEITRARTHLQCKAAAIMATAVASYWGLVIAQIGVLGHLICGAVLVLSMIGIATSVMHDANHGAFSRIHRVNRMVGFASDLLGASSLLWRIKHAAHHADTNVIGHDPDIDQTPFARLAPQQRWRAWHRYQHLYLWPLYGFLGIQWFLVSDWLDLFRRPSEVRPDGALRRRDRVTVVAGKALHATWALVLPLAFHRWWVVLTVYALSSWCVGFSLAVMFQVAHAVEGADITGAEVARRGDDFVTHQLRTTLDVRGELPAVGGWLRGIMGGLDHQIEHHLAPHVPHTLYPRMARRLQADCSAASVRYREHRNLFGAVASHARHLRTMARRPLPA